tara:strand:+ start:716 stop:1660 length:945 start_codon:yes stop_codon:yes gene_type:complete
MKRRYASMYASPVEEEVIEDGTIEGVNQYKKDTPGQEADIDEGTALQVKMALGDVGLKGTWKNEKVYVKKRDVKKAEKALKGNVIYRGKPPVVVGEEVEIDEAKKPTRDTGMECMECGKKFRAKLSTLQYGKTKCPKCKSTDIDFAFGESVEIDEANEFWAVIDKAKGGEVMAVSSDEKGAKSSVKMSNFSKHDYHFNKDPRTLKIVKVAGSYKKGEKMIGTKLSYKEEVEVDEAKGTAYPATIDTLRMIVKEKQHQTIMFKSGKAIVDLFTASAMVQVYDALKKPDMKKTFEKMITDKAGFMKTQAFAMKMVG